MKRTLGLTACVFALVFVTAGCPKTTSVQGAGGKKLTVTKPSSLTIKQGTTEQIKITIVREKFTDPVAVRFDKLPAGVTVVENKTEIPASDNSATFTFKADDNAAVVSNQDATVTVSGPGDLKQTETFPITVNKKT